VEAEKSMPSGRVFEKVFFGRTDENPGEFFYPPKSDLSQSIQEVIEDNWRRWILFVETGIGDEHNPTYPKLGMTHRLWRAVKKESS